MGALGLTMLRYIGLVASAKRVHREICLYSGILRRGNPGNFFKTCEKGLDALALYDSRCFSLFQRHVKRIVGSEFHTQLALAPRMMELNYDVASGINSVDLASLMVHELTHARLARFVKEDKMERIERLCLVEQERFIRRAGWSPRKTERQLLNTRWWTQEAKQRRLDKTRKRLL